MTQLHEEVSASEFIPGLEPARLSVPAQIERRLAILARRQMITLVMCAITLAMVGFLFYEVIRFELALHHISDSFDTVPPTLPADMPGYDPGQGG